MRGELWQVFFFFLNSPIQKNVLIDPQGRPTVKAVSDHYFCSCCLSVRPFVRRVISTGRDCGFGGVDHWWQVFSFFLIPLSKNVLILYITKAIGDTASQKLVYPWIIAILLHIGGAKSLKVGNRMRIQCTEYILYYIFYIIYRINCTYFMHVTLADSLYVSEKLVLYQSFAGFLRVAGVLPVFSWFSKFGLFTF